RTGELPGGQAAVALPLLLRITGHTAGVNAVAFDSDGKTIVSGGADRSIRVWDASTGKERLKVADGRQEIGCVAIVPGSGVILAGQGVTVRALDPVSGRELYKLSGHNDAGRSIAVSADGRRAATGGDDRTVRVWDLLTLREIRRFTTHKAGVTGVALSADGKLALSGSRDQTLRLWEATSGKERVSFAVPRGPVLCVAL